MARVDRRGYKESVTGPRFGQPKFLGGGSVALAPGPNGSTTLSVLITSDRAKTSVIDMTLTRDEMAQVARWMDTQKETTSR